MEKQVNKLKILSLKNPAEYFKNNTGLSGAVKAVGGALSFGGGITFEVQINPEQINHNFKILYHDAKTPGKGVGEADKQFDKIEPEVLELKFILDGTGVVQDNAFLSGDIVNIGSSALDFTYVTTKITQLKTTVYNFIDESHKPPTLVVNWGKRVFIGVLENLLINETLMHPSGLPLRAEVNLKIKEQGIPKSARALMSLLSPDLTRYHRVKAGDKLSSLCGEYYENEHYYIEVAKANGLVNFRKITPGENLVFPPIGSTE